MARSAEETGSVTGSELGGPVLGFTRLVMAIDLTGLMVVALAPVLVPGSTARFFA